MTSKNCSTNNKLFDLSSIWDIFKKNIWLPTLAFILFFFSMPVATAMQLQNITANDPRYISTLQFTDQLQRYLSFFYDSTNVFIIMIFIITAIISACTVFKYLHNRKQVDFYHSLPLKREKLFISNFIGGLLLIIVPYLLNILLSLITIAGFGYFDQLHFMPMIQSIAVHLLFFLSIYSFTVLAAMLTGNVFINLLLTPVFLGIGPALLGIYSLIMNDFYDTFFYGIIPMEKYLAYSSPLARYLNINNMPLKTPDVLILLILSLVIIAFSLFLYKKRPSEGAGHAVVFKISRPILKYPIIFIASTLFGFFFHSIGDQGGRFWMFFGFICGALITNAIIEIIYHFDFKAITKNLKGLLIFYVVFALFISVPLFDIGSYDDYLPESQNVAKININMPNVNRIASSTTNNNTSNNYYNDSYLQQELAIGLLEDKANIESALSIIGKAKNQLNHVLTDEEAPEYPINQQLEKVQADGPSTTFTMNNGQKNIGPDMTTYVEVVYTLTNGKTKAREYNLGLDVKDIIPELKQIIASEEYKTNHYLINQFDNANILVENVYPFNYSGNQQLPICLLWKKEAKNELIQAYKADLMEYTIEDLMAAPAIGEISFRLYKTEAPVFSNNKDLDNSNNTPYTSVTISIYKSFDRTLAVLAKLGISYQAFNIDLNNVDHLTIASPYLEEIKAANFGIGEENMQKLLANLAKVSGDDLHKDKVSFLEIRDREQIKQLLSLTATPDGLINSCFHSYRKLLDQTTITVKYKSNSSTNDSERKYFTRIS